MFSNSIHYIHTHVKKLYYHSIKNHHKTVVGSWYCIFLLYLLLFFYGIWYCTWSIYSNWNAMQAFQEAWAEACKVESSTMLVPADYVFFVGPISFSGPYCKPSIVFQVTYQTQREKVAGINRERKRENNRKKMKRN